VRMQDVMIGNCRGLAKVSPIAALVGTVWSCR
jgi:hypothetical protein